MTVARIINTARFPRAAIVVEILAIAELCRGTTRALEALAENASNYEPSSLRRLAHGHRSRALRRSLGAGGIVSFPTFEIAVCPTTTGRTKLVIEFELGASAVKQLASFLLVIGARLQSRVFG